MRSLSCSVFFLSLCLINACESDDDGDDAVGGTTGDAGADSMSGGAADLAGGSGGNAAGKSGASTGGSGAAVGSAGADSGGEPGAQTAGAGGGGDEGEVGGVGGTGSGDWLGELGEFIGRAEPEEELIVIDESRAFLDADSATSHIIQRTQALLDAEGGFLFATGSRYSFVTKYDAALEIVWQADLDSLLDTGSGSTVAMTFTSEGESYLGGVTTKALPGEALVASDAWVGKLDGEGQLLWARQWGATGSQSTQQLLVTEAGVIGVGSAEGQAPGNPSDVRGGPFISRYTSEGDRTGLTQYPPNTKDGRRSAFLGKNGEVYQVTSANPSILRRFDSEGSTHETSSIGAPGTDLVAQQVALNPEKTAFYACSGSFGPPGVPPRLFEFGLDGQVRWYRQPAVQEEVIDSVEGTTWKGAYQTCDGIFVSEDSIYLTGTYVNSYTGGSVQRETLETVFIARFSLEGERLWFRELTNLPEDRRVRSAVQVMQTGADGDLRVWMTGPLSLTAAWFHFSLSKVDGELL